MSRTIVVNILEKFEGVLGFTAGLFLFSKGHTIYKGDEILSSFGVSNDLAFETLERDYANQAYDLKLFAKERLTEYVDPDTPQERKEKLVKNAIKSYLAPVNHYHLLARDIVTIHGDTSPDETVIMKEGDYKDLEDHDEQLLVAAEVKSCVDHYRMISHPEHPDPIAVFEACLHHQHSKQKLYSTDQWRNCAEYNKS